MWRKCVPTAPDISKSDFLPTSSWSWLWVLTVQYASEGPPPILSSHSITRRGSGRSAWRADCTATHRGVAAQSACQERSAPRRRGICSYLVCSSYAIRSLCYSWVDYLAKSAVLLWLRTLNYFQQPNGHDWTWAWRPVNCHRLYFPLSFGLFS